MDRPGGKFLVIRKCGRRRAGHSTSFRYPALPMPRLYRVILPVSDIEAATDFYRDLLGIRANA